MLTFLTKLSSPEAYHRSDHAKQTPIAEYHRILSLNPKTPVFKVTRTQDTFLGCLSSNSNPGHFLGLWPLFLQSARRTNNFGLGAIVLTCLVFDLQPKIEIRTFSQSFGTAMFPSWSQGISMPSLVKIRFFILKL
jgi:hypothetical protein